MRITKDERERERREEMSFQKQLETVSENERRVFDEIIDVNAWVKMARHAGLDKTIPHVRRRYPGPFGKKIVARLRERLK